MQKPDTTPWEHSHSFGQEQKREGEARTLIVIGLTSAMMVVEIAAGIAFGSMALLADGIHMASHAVALGITAFAYIYARKHAHDSRFSFGTGKVNSLGGFTGAVVLALFALMMVWESAERLVFPTQIAFDSAIAVAVIGLLVNGASVFILGDNHVHSHDHHHEDDDDHHHEHAHGHEHHHHDHNLRSAYLHVLADALTSLTAIVALLTAKYFGWIWMDPVMGIVGAALVAKWSLGLLRQTSRLLLDHQAPNTVLLSIREAIEKDEPIRIADLHTWSIGPGIYNVVMTVVTDQSVTPDGLKARLDPHQYPHITIEIQTTEKP
ncbi:MAG: CDF family Co(II)/Ni(II) efflux transporter DmeF [Verrucomicrobiae bacterium]|nr:CDF family Co(II)/Ni(II) efflux transporter DmeF [Verrucomicrobiae bacterium]